MRLFKGGGIGLGPYAYAPTGSGQWSRIATGAPATRPGAYLLSQEEAERLADLAIALEARPDPDGALSWAVARFEMGCARESALEGLSDHLLALRSVLEGQGPVGASLPMRASALMSADESCDRIEARERIEGALQLERALMNGGPTKDGLELAAWIEDGTRRVLREAALGELGTDLNTAADETLIASGLEGGDAEIAITAVTNEPDHDVSNDPDLQVSPEMPGREAEDISVARKRSPSPDDDRNLIPSEEGEGPSYNANASQEVQMDDEDTGIMEPVPAENEIRITANNWLDEVSVEKGTMEWTAAQGEGVGDRERLDTPRVRHLFQVPEDADWEVRELNYDHYHRRIG
jgi:hypothetical protein